MQDRYVGDVGDYAKYSFLTAISKGMRLGVAWYRFPDEDHNSDGKHVVYLKKPYIWRRIDPNLFDTLRKLVSENQRSIKEIEQSNIFPDGTKFASQMLDFDGKIQERTRWRAN